MKNPVDLYRLKAEKLAQLRTTIKLGAKAANKVINALESSKHAPLERLVFGLGIRHVGDRTAELLAHRFGTLDAIIVAPVEELEQVEEVGPRIAESIRAYFDSDANRSMIERLRAEGLEFGKTTPRVPRLSGEVVVFTGTLGIARADAADLASAAGYEVGKSVTQRTTLVVVGDTDLRKLAGRTKSSKHRKAEQLALAGQPIRIIGESDFRSIIETGTRDNLA